MAGHKTDVGAKYAVPEGSVYLSGNQALVRLPIEQAKRDAALNRNTAGFISGYRGSPLGHLDQDFKAVEPLLKEIDTSSAAGELIFHVFGSIAHFERRLIAERTKDGIAAARAKGKLPGRRPLGPEKASAALKLVEAGVSPTEAARQLGLGRATIYREMALAGVRRTA
ncbi:recombinase family protein [Sphingobium sp. SCG-1]|uniref:recombinase family protein n=1 Tax=Sphingobium sp. SCG-1 TaxID=2072936 RepID=UPI0026C0761A|nr:recombinase family protein [Sphingobium sp. SCG-1]